MENKVTINGNEYTVTNFIQIGGEPNLLSYSLQLVLDDRTLDTVIKDFKNLPDSLEIKQNGITVFVINGCTELCSCSYDLVDETEIVTVIIREPSLLSRVQYLESTAKTIEGFKADLETFKKDMVELKKIEKLVKNASAGTVAGKGTVTDTETNLKE